MFSGAAIMGVLQAILVVLLLSTTGVLLDRWHAWRSSYESYRAYPETDYYPNDRGELSESTTTGTLFGPTPIPLTTTTRIVHQAAFAVWPDEGKWYRDSSLSAFLEMHLTHHVAMYCLWLVCLVFFALAFRYRRPALVLPNLVMQTIGLVLMMILAGIVIAKLVLLNKQYGSMSYTDKNEAERHENDANWQTQRDDINVRYAFYAILLGVLVIVWVVQVLFIWINIDFYQYLRDKRHTVHPDEHPRGYHHQHAHAILREEEPKTHVHEERQIPLTMEPTTKIYTRGDVMT